MNTYAYIMMLMAAFTLPFSMPASRFFVVVSLLFIIRGIFTRKTRFVFPMTAWCALAFAIAAVVSTALGPSPALGFDKISKVLWFVAIPVTATVVTSYRHLTALLAAFAIGSGILAIQTIVQIPVRGAAGFIMDKMMDFWPSVQVLWSLQPGQWQDAIASAAAGKSTAFIPCLLAAGSMGDAQRLMIGITVALGFAFSCRIEGKASRYWWLLIIIQTAALILSFKRGSWICTAAVLAVFVGMRMPWRHIVGLFLLMLLVASLPIVRGRLMDLPREFSQERGGRYLMWTKIAPELIKQRPWLGVGYRCVTPKMMKRVDRMVEKKRNHLHSNVFEILVEMGIVGFTIYLLWMVFAMRDTISFVLRSRTGPPVHALPAWVLLLSLSALIANGLVEYNFADAEIVLIYGILMGCAAAGRQRLAPAQHGT